MAKQYKRLFPLTLFILAFLLWGCQGDEAPPQADEIAQLTTEPTPLESGSTTAVAVAISTTPAPEESQPDYPAPEETASTESGYPPPPEATAEPTPYPEPTQQTNGENAGDQELFLPVITNPQEAPPTATPLPQPSPTPSPTPIPTLDFTAVAADLQAQGLALSTNKIGFHLGVGGNQNGLGEWIRRMDEAGIPVFLKTVSDAGPIYEAQELMKQSGVPHVLVFRHSGDEYDVPDYTLPPAVAAQQHWDRHLAVWPPELDPEHVWLETINEIDKNQSEWLAEFSIATAALAERDGYKWAAFGWSSGEPEISHWQGAKMLEFLRLVASNPDKLAIALHEYSYTKDNIADGFPFKLGRFQQLFDVADRNGFPRPTVLITEWGWEYQDIPPLDQAMADIQWAEELYAPHPQIKGAAIWYLGPGYADIDNQTQKLILPVMIDSLTSYQTRPLE